MDYFLIGEKLPHSLSPRIHRLIGDYGYGLCELNPDDLRDFFRRRDFRGINVTIPYKKAVIPYLDALTERAKKIGAVNTVVRENGRLIGDNTDYEGLKALLFRVIKDVKGKKTLIFGTGGTARTAKMLLEDLGAAPVLLVSRTSGKGNLTYEEIAEHRDAVILINTTPVGMYPNVSGQAVDLNVFTHPEAVLDVVYNPLKTDLILEAEDLHIPSAGGLYMLVSQAVFAARDFGFDVPAEKADEIYRRILTEKRNIVLIGMPGAGKTSVGRLVAEKRGRKFVDTDELIENREKMSIPRIFSEKSEAYFRASERRIAAELSPGTELVIATGGGLPIDPENVRELKRNGVFVFLDRTPEEIGAVNGRPLVKDRASLEKLCDERRPIYEKIADLTVRNMKTPEEAADFIVNTLPI